MTKQRTKRPEVTEAIVACIVLLCLAFSLRRGFIRVAADAMVQPRIMRLMECIDKRDAEGIKEVFSQNAVEEAEDLDGDISRLFDLIPDKITNWKSDNSTAVETRIMEGMESRRSRGRYYITADNQKYKFYVLDYTLDQADHDNVGIRSIQVLKEGDAKRLYKKEEPVGIYIPEEYLLEE